MKKAKKVNEPVLQPVLGAVPEATEAATDVVIEKATIGETEVAVTVIDEIADSLKSEPTQERIYIRMRDIGACWGVMNYHIANRQVKKVPFDNIVKQGIKDNAIVQLTAEEIAEYLKSKKS